MQLNKNILIVSQYNGTHEKVQCKCLVCENEWSTDASVLLSGYGCPKCGQRQRLETIEKRKNIDIGELDGRFDENGLINPDYKEPEEIPPKQDAYEPVVLLTNE